MFCLTTLVPCSLFSLRWEDSYFFLAYTDKKNHYFVPEFSLSFIHTQLHTFTQWKAEAQLTVVHADVGGGGREANIFTGTAGVQKMVAAITAAFSTYLARSVPDGRLKLVGVGEGVAEMSRDCSGIGD